MTKREQTARELLLALADVVLALPEECHTIRQGDAKERVRVALAKLRAEPDWTDIVKHMLVKKEESNASKEKEEDGNKEEGCEEDGGRGGQEFRDREGGQG